MSERFHRAICWCAISPMGVISIKTLSHSKSVAVKNAKEVCQARSWEQLRRKGWRVARMRIAFHEMEADHE